MSTPTFPVTPVDDRDERFAQAVEAFQRGEIRSSDVARLSDLRRDEMDRLRLIWPQLDEGQRVALIDWITELSEDRVELTFGRVLRHALADPAPRVRQIALSALWEDEGPDLKAVLVCLLHDDPDQDVRSGAAALLGRCVDRLATDESSAGGQTVREALFTSWHDQTEGPLVRRRALESVSGFGADREVRQAIGEAYDDGDATLTAGAVRAMGRTANLSYFGTILAELASDDAELRYEAAMAAGELGDERAVPELISLIDDEDEDVKLAALNALGQIGGREAVRTLEALTTGDGDFAMDEAIVADALTEAMLTTDPLQAPATP